MSTPATRNPKRERKKQGQQQRRAAEMAALRRQQRNRRMIRFAIAAVVVVAALFLLSSRGGSSKKSTTAATKGTTTTTVAAAPAAAAAAPLSCDTPTGANTDMKTKPKVTVPSKPATTLSCRDLVIGTGKTVAAGDTVTVDYVGVSQSTGKEFDTSWGKGTPFSTPLSDVIKGWTDGIPGMKVGGRRELIIPGDQAYGAQGRAAAGIGPNDTLVFIVDVKDTKASA